MLNCLSIERVSGTVVVHYIQPHLSEVNRWKRRRVNAFTYAHIGQCVNNITNTSIWPKSSETLVHRCNETKGLRNLEIDVQCIVVNKWINTLSVHITVKLSVLLTYH